MNIVKEFGFFAVSIVAVTALSLSMFGCGDLTCEEDCPDGVSESLCDFCAAGPQSENSCVEDTCLD